MKPVRLFLDAEDFLQPLDLLVTKESDWDAIPEVELLSERVAGGSGSLVFGARLTDRFLRLHVHSRGCYDEESIARAWRECARVFSPLNGWMELRMHDAPGFFGEVMVTRTYKTEWHRNFLEFDVTLLLKDGVFKKSVPTVVVGRHAAHYADSDVPTPFSLERVSSSAGSGEVSALVLNGKAVRLKDAPVGVVYNSELGTVERAGVNFMRCLVPSSHGFLRLAPGENDISVHSDFRMTYRDWRFFV